MTFLHIAFLGGALAVVVPIVLHLIMRQQPKHVEFPALRFIKLRETANRRQMRFRHWLLLALRCAVIGLLAIALARPSILASGVLGDQEAPVAAALVFDTNPRMQYKQQNQTRLQVAQETAQWLLPQLPAESDVAVVDSRTASAVFAVDLGAARQRIERLDATTISQPLGEAFAAALRLVHESDKPRKEVYLFTDLTRAAWSPDAMREVERQMAEYVGVGVYVIDVGVKEPTDFGLGDANLSAQVLSRNGTLRIQADLVHCGNEGERTVEAYLIDRENGKPSIRGQQSFTFRAGESQRTDFQLRGLAAGVQQGYLKIVGEDALACDDTRWFTVEVRPAWRVLIAAPRDGERKPQDYALFLTEALAPYEFRMKKEAAFECDVISTEELAKKSLEGYAAIAIVDPQPLEPLVWQKLHGYVTAGGGLGIFLGNNATPIDSFNAAIAQELLPAKLVRQWRAASEVYLAPENFQHPLLAKFRALGSTVPWESFPIFRHWQLSEPAGDVGVVLRYSNNLPAVLERPVGKGRVITTTTPISDPANPLHRETWNLLPTGEEPWPFVVLANAMFNYLVGSEQERLNYTAGDTAVVHLGSGEKYPFYSLTTPRGDQIRTPLDDKQNAIVVTSTEAAGNYRLLAGGAEQGVDLGFSVNLPANISQLERVEPQELKEVFGDTPFRLARNRDEIDRSVSAGRVGQELFPYLIVLLAIILAGEQVLSNRFYQDHDAGQKRDRPMKPTPQPAVSPRAAQPVPVDVP